MSERKATGVLAWRPAPTGSVALAMLFAACLAACSGEGAGAGGWSGSGANSNGDLPGSTQTAPPSGGGGGGGDGSGTVSGGTVLVTDAYPVSGNGAVVTQVGTVSTGLGTLVQVVFDGSSADGSAQHRFTVDYDSATGIVIRATHAWGASGAYEGFTECVQTLPSYVQTQQPCGASVRVFLSLGQVSFDRTLLRGAGLYRSVLTGQLTYVSVSN